MRCRPPANALFAATAMLFLVPAGADGYAPAGQTGVSDSVTRAAGATAPPQTPPPALTPARTLKAARVWREFVKNPRNGIDLVYDCIKAYPDAPQVLSSLAQETGLPIERVREALGPLALNLLLSYTHILTVARSPNKLRRYAAAMGRFYRERDIAESEYTMLNAIIDRHVQKKVGKRFSAKDKRAPWEVLEAVKTAIFKSSASHVLHHSARNTTAVPDETPS